MHGIYACGTVPKGVSLVTHRSFKAIRTEGEILFFDNAFWAYKVYSSYYCYVYLKLGDVPILLLYRDNDRGYKIIIIFIIILLLYYDLLLDTDSSFHYIYRIYLNDYIERERRVYGTN